MRKSIKDGVKRPIDLMRRIAHELARRWRSLLVSLAILGVVLGIGGFLFAWSGLMPISASSGHWPVTRWVLQFAMHNAVETHAMAVEKPARTDLTDPALVLKGAGHYATGCVPCHGAPGQKQSLIAKQMTPEPPFLPPKVKEWTPEQLFWIVKHGIKFTPMPAWVSLQRDDEVWAMVAFLQKLPTLSPERYQQLAHGELADAGTAAGTGLGRLLPPDEPRHAALANCARCHGLDGNGRGLGAFPKLAGQSEAYLRASLEAYASGDRHSGIMQPIAVDLDEAAMRALASHYAGMDRSTAQQPQPSQAAADDPPAGNTDSASIARGREITRQGIPEQGVPSCVDCHGPGHGPRNPHYPELAGQYADYIALQLTLFKEGKRGGTAYADIMHSAVERMDGKEIRDVALYYHSLGQESGDVQGGERE